MWESESNFRLNGTPFHCAYPSMNPPDGYQPILKAPDMVAPYEEIISELRPQRIVELGIRRGGSTALLYELARESIERLVAFELDPTPAGALQRFIEAGSLDNVIRPHYGVDQADRVRVAELVASGFGAEPIDLVVDDASHLYGPSLASFETLFPLVRPGGVYIIEDWTANCFKLNRTAEAMKTLPQDQTEALAEYLATHLSDSPSIRLQRSKLLALLSLQFVLMRATETEVIEEVTVDRYWTLVRRGTAELDPETFRVEDHYYDHMHLFVGDWVE